MGENLYVPPSMRYLVLLALLTLLAISGCAAAALGLANPDFVSDQIPHHH